LRRDYWVSDEDDDHEAGTMTMNRLQEQLIKYLTDAHSIEEQALVQMKAAPKVAADPALAAVFNQHRIETDEHERLVRQRLEALRASPAALKDAAGKLTGKGFALFAQAQPDTPGKLLAHAFSYEHMEVATYDMIARVAERAGDEATPQMARLIGEQERAMAQRLSGLFDQVVDASLRGLSPDDLGRQLDKYLQDAHAIEAQAIQLLSKSPRLAGGSELAVIYDAHRAESEEHQQLIDTRLRAREASASALKDAALRLGALNWGLFFAAQPDTPAKLAAFSYAFEHLEIASYELLRRIAGRAGDSQTAAVADTILGDERAAANKIHGAFDEALDASLEAQGVGAR
jgi:ferritin-like metal-binding protein YciE